MRGPPRPGTPLPSRCCCQVPPGCRPSASSRLRGRPDHRTSASRRPGRRYAIATSARADNEGGSGWLRQRARSSSASLGLKVKASLSQTLGTAGQTASASRVRSNRLGRSGADLSNVGYLGPTNLGRRRLHSARVRLAFRRRGNSTTPHSRLSVKTVEEVRSYTSASALVLLLKPPRFCAFLSDCDLWPDRRSSLARAFCPVGPR